MMLLKYGDCKVDVSDDLISCRYRGHFDWEQWRMILSDYDICYIGHDKKEFRFKIDDIQEFQFEMGNGAYPRSTQDIPAASAFIILKSDPDPKSFFHFSVAEDYVLYNQTKAYDFCYQILNNIGNRYGIPVAYKLSIDTKKKRNAIAWVPLLLIITFILIYLSIRYGS